MGETTFTPAVERPALIGDVVLDRIRDAIVSRDLEPGQRLSEASLASQLGVSKTPVREALMRLRLIGLVTAEGGRLRVVAASRAAVREAFDLRAVLESAAAASAARVADAATALQLRERADASLARAKDHDLAGFRASDVAFHDAVLAAAGNELLSTHAAQVRDLCQALRQRDVIGDSASMECGQAHQAITTAIADGASDLASSLMRGHVEYVRDKVLAAVDGDPHN